MLNSACARDLRPVELQHKAGDGHAPWHLERHSANQVHPVTSIRVKC